MVAAVLDAPTGTAIMNRGGLLSAAVMVAYGIIGIQVASRCGGAARAGQNTSDCLTAMTFSAC